MTGVQTCALPISASERDAYDWTPDASRRARGFAVYAALRSLGKEGVTALIERCCAHARRLAAGVGELPGARILNEVALNQVLVRFESDEQTAAVGRRVREGGEAWMGDTEWGGSRAIRLSVSGWATTTEDIDRTVAAFAAAVAG